MLKKIKTPEKPARESLRIADHFAPGKSAPGKQFQSRVRAAPG
jgi:hypothetical protein